jgi:hypothetical protein
MTGYTKLFSSIIASTIWREKDHTRIVWITLLAMAGKDGVVEASLPGLADLSRVSVPRCREAIHALESPDQDSRSDEFEGRRIKRVEGGWLILNHAKYRNKLSAEERRAYKTAKQREYRKRPVDSSVDTNSTSGQSRHIAEAEAEAEAEADQSQKHTPVRELAGFAFFWEAYPKKIGQPAAQKAWLRAVQADDRWPEVLEGLERWKNSAQWSEARFIPYPEKFLLEKRWCDIPLKETANGREKLTGPEAARRTFNNMGFVSPSTVNQAEPPIQARSHKRGS